MKAGWHLVRRKSFRRSLYAMAREAGLRRASRRRSLCCRVFGHTWDFGYGVHRVRCLRCGMTHPGVRT